MTSSVCVPTDPVDPATDTVTGPVFCPTDEFTVPASHRLRRTSAALYGEAQDGARSEPVLETGHEVNPREDEQHGVDPIEKAPLAGQQVAHVLDAQVALDH